jgi:hypothetical protein
VIILISFFISSFVLPCMLPYWLQKGCIVQG